MKFKDCLVESVKYQLSEETGLQTAKKLQKQFGKHDGGKIHSQKWKNHDYEPAPDNEQHHFVVPVHRDKVKEHLINNGWKFDRHAHEYHHPTEGARHKVEVSMHGWDDDKSKIKVFKTNHKGSMATY